MTSSTILFVGVVVHEGKTPAWQVELLDDLAQSCRTVAIVIPSTANVTPSMQYLWRLTAASCRSLVAADLPISHERLAVSFDSDVLPIHQKPDVIVDLTGDAPDRWGVEIRHGLLRLSDGGGRPIGHPFPALGAGQEGRRIRVVRLARSNGSLVAVVRWARFGSDGLSNTASLERTYRIAIRLVLQAVKDIRAGALHEESHPQSKSPRLTVVRAAAALMADQCRLFFERVCAIALSESWMIGVIDDPIDQLITKSEEPTITWQGQRETHRYLADPFGWPGDVSRIYCEEFQYDRGVGTILELALSRGHIIAENKVAFPTVGHLSYPFLFRHGAHVYCLPEAGASRRCVLYVESAHGRAWQPHAVLLESTAAADPTIFEWGGLFWLAYTDMDIGASDNLCLCYAERLEGPWIPHSNNPVKIDIRSARPAGSPFWHDGQLYRPAQDCGPTYGDGISINRVLKCSPTEFREEAVRLLSPARLGRNPHGLHTISAWDGRCLVDGKRHVIKLLVTYRKVAARLTRLGLLRRKVRLLEENE